jgi:hypothetical protein
LKYVTLFEDGISSGFSHCPTEVRIPCFII